MQDSEEFVLEIPQQSDQVTSRISREGNIKIKQSSKCLFLSLDTPEELRLENWPCFHEAGKDAIQEMIKTHHVILIPAYDANLSKTRG